MTTVGVMLFSAAELAVEGNFQSVEGDHVRQQGCSSMRSLVDGGLDGKGGWWTGSNGW